MIDLAAQSIELAHRSSVLSKRLLSASSKSVFIDVSDERYTVRLAEDRHEVEAALSLRYDVFSVEMSGRKAAGGETRLEFDAYDFKCRHLIVVSKETGKTVGTYRLNSTETVRSTDDFYSANEFTIEDLPREVLRDGIEIGRACIALEHRNTKVFFLLWKALLACLRQSGKRYFFGCCSIFTQDQTAGRKVFRRLIRDGRMHESFSVMPCRNGLSLVGEEDEVDADEVELPALFNMYLRIGARVCGPPMIDREFGTIDFFVVLDTKDVPERYRKMFS